MIPVVFWLAVACAVLGAVTRSRTAMALLGSVAACLVMDYAQVPFDFVTWVLIDLLVIAIIIPYEFGDSVKTVIRRMSKNDIWVVLLFPVAWVAYLTYDPWRYYGSMLVVISQLFLMFPCGSLYTRFRENFKNRDEWTCIDPMVAA